MRLRDFNFSWLAATNMNFFCQLFRKNNIFASLFQKGRCFVFFYLRAGGDKLIEPKGNQCKIEIIIIRP